MFTILNRMILWELLKVFGLALVSITGILLLAGIVAEASQHGLGPAQLILIIPLLIPSTLPYTLPATTLFTTCVVYGRLSHDNEILAIRAAGINVLYVLVPALFLGTVMTLVTMGLYAQLIPTTHHLMKSMFVNDIENLLYSMLKRDGRIDYPQMDYVIHVKKVQGKKLLEAQFMHRDKNGRYDVIARAREAELLVDLAHNQILVHMRHCYITGGDGHEAYVEDKVWPVDLPRVPQGKFRAREMTWGELVEHRQELLANVDRLDAELALTTAQVTIAQAPDVIADRRQNLMYQQGVVQAEIRGIDAEMHMRPALALGCLCFVLVGCPVGIWFSRSDYLSSFVTCFLPIVFLYYPLLLCGLNLAKSGKLAAPIGAWAANVGMVLIALLLYRRLVRN